MPTVPILKKAKTGNKIVNQRFTPPKPPPPPSQKETSASSQANASQPIPQSEFDKVPFMSSTSSRVQGRYSGISYPVNTPAEGNLRPMPPTPPPPPAAYPKTLYRLQNQSIVLRSPEGMEGELED